MSLFIKDISASTLAPFMGSVDTGARSAPSSAMPIDSRHELTYTSWQKIVKNSRWLYANAGLPRRFFKATARYTVGGGICPIPDSGNVEFDKVLEDYFCNWADTPGLVDVHGQSSWWQMQKKALVRWMRDGDHFVAKVPHDDFVSSAGIRVLGLPRLQCMESHVVASANGGGYDGKDIDGYAWGIKYVGKRPSKYRIRVDSSADNRDLANHMDKDAGEMLWLVDLERVEEPRGVPWLHHGINSLVDIMDLTALEKHTQKLHSAVAAAIKRKIPSATKGATGTVTTEKRTPKGGDRRRVVAFDNFLGGAGILQLQLDEEFELKSSNRESSLFTGFIDHLVRDICEGFDVTPEIFWNITTLDGPSARLALEDAQNFFESLQDLLVTKFCVPIYLWVIARGVERGELVPPAGCNPYSAHWQGPAKVTIDQGREGELELSRLRSGCGTWAEFWNKRGKSGRKMVYARIDELADAMEYAASKKGPGHVDGVPFDYVMSLDKGGSGDPKDEGEARKSPAAKKPTKKTAKAA
jgi:capsid protein